MQLENEYILSPKSKCASPLFLCIVALILSFLHFTLNPSVQEKMALLNSFFVYSSLPSFS